MNTYDISDFTDLVAEKSLIEAINETIPACTDATINYLTKVLIKYKLADKKNEPARRKELAIRLAEVIRQLDLEANDLSYEEKVAKALAEENRKQMNADYISAVDPR